MVILSMMEEMHLPWILWVERKHTLSSTDPSSSESSRITKNMEQIADSINGLVGVARQSQQTQQINILQCQKEL